MMIPRRLHKLASLLSHLPQCRQRMMQRVMQYSHALSCHPPGHAKTSSRQRLGTSLLWVPLVALTFVGGAMAQTWPTKPVRIITPFAAGGTVDIVARLLGNALAQSTGQSFVVESRPGAGGAIGAVAVARAPADGYTLLFATNSTHAMGPALSDKLPYNAVDDFTPIALVVESNVFLLASPALKVKTLSELLELARAKPGSINYGSGGQGTHGHLTYELLKAQTGVELTHVPYKGIGAAYPDLQNGTLQLLTDAVGGGLQQVKSGRAVALAVSGPGRSAIAPDVPTVGETVPGYSVVAWFALYGPRGLPPALTARINEEVNKVLRSPELTARLESLGLDAGSGSAAKFAEYAAADRKRWFDLVRERNIKGE